MEPSIENDPAVQDLVNFVLSTKDRGLRVTASDLKKYDWDVPYVSRTALHDYFTLKKVHELLRVFSNGDNPVYDLVDAGQIKRQYSKVFCLLVVIGHGHFITEFVRHGIDDQQLPLGPHRSDKLPHSPSDPQFFDKFYQRQWQFCVPELKVTYDRHFDSKFILPIRRVKTLGLGGSATAYQIEVHGSYNQLETDPAGQHHACSTDSHHPAPNTFVLKCYSGDSGEETYYNNEWKALKRVHTKGPCRHIIGIFGSFKLGEVHNVLLEYADQGTLENYLARDDINPPCEADEIIHFWKSILPITQGLNRIHNTDQSTTEGPQIFQGWHHDIKPSNILIKSRSGGSKYDFECKLADLGLSHFKRSQGSQSETTDKDPYGTRTYGAPECLRYDSISDDTGPLVKQNVDVYSLGCVLSVVATWVAKNWLTVLEYRERRRQEIERKGGFRDGDDFFHNGQDDLLNTVVSHHAELTSVLRHCDYVTNSVLKMVKDDMLRSSNSGGRKAARCLQRQSERIIEDAQAQYNKTRPVSSSSSHMPSSSPHVSSNTLYTHEPAMIPPQPPQPNGPLNFNPPPQSPFQSNSTYRQSLEHEQGTSWNGNPGNPDSPYWEEAEAGEDNYTAGKTMNQTRSLTVRPGTLPQQFQSLMHNSSATTKEHFGSPIHLSTPFGSRRSIDFSHLQAETQAKRDHLITTSPTRVLKDELITHSFHPAKEDQVLYSSSGNPSTRNQLPKNDNTRPKWPVENALHWISVKRDKEPFEFVRIPNQSHLDELKGRDQAFLIDNSASMLDHWKKARKVLRLLGYLVKNYDPNGVDLYFTCPFKKYANLTKTTAMLEIFDRQKPSNESHRSDMSARLSDIVGEYRNKLDKIHERRFLFKRPMTRETRKLSLYVFTDAVWQPGCEVAPVIRSLITTLKEKNLHKQQIGIQFIQFGDKAEETKRLKDLDRLRESGYVDMDVVDTELASGDVFKMLLGAISPWFDDDPPLPEDLSGFNLRSPQATGKRFLAPT